MNLTKSFSIFALPIIAISTSLMAEPYKGTAPCKAKPAASCNNEKSDSCCNTYCLGPENYGVNPPVNPRTCNGDVVVNAALFFWDATQDGMDYGVQTEVNQADEERNNLIRAKFLHPNPKWDFGFKLGLAYNTPCDGWDIGVLWTHYKGKATSHNEAEADDNTTLLPIWSNYLTGTADNQPTYATDIEANWRLNLNLIDIELGREFWNSRLLSLRPFVGLRVALLDQDYQIMHKGGTWSQTTPTLNGLVHLENNFHSLGLRGGLASTWNFGCGFALYGNFALSILYGSFKNTHNESNRESSAPFDKTKLLETNNHTDSSVLATDIGLGLQYKTLFCQCKYGFTAQLGWEHHLFMNQNQMWRINKVLVDDSPTVITENVYSQSRGDLSTQGWTLSFKFDF